MVGGGARIEHEWDAAGPDCVNSSGQIHVKVMRALDLPGSRDTIARVSCNGVSGSYRRPTIGVVAGWQVYERTTPNWFLEAVLRGVADAGATLGCDVLLSCGVDGQTAEPTDVRPGWPVTGDEGGFSCPWDPGTPTASSSSPPFGL